MNATELFDRLAAIPAGQDAGSTDGVAQSRVVSGIEHARTDAVDERKIRGGLVGPGNSPDVSSVLRVISHRIPIAGWKSSRRSALADDSLSIDDDAIRFVDGRRLGFRPGALLRR